MYMHLLEKTTVFVDKTVSFLTNSSVFFQLTMYLAQFSRELMSNRVFTQKGASWYGVGLFHFILY